MVIESARRAALATELHRSRFPDAPLHIGILLPNVADFVFWLGAAALSGTTVVGLNPTRSDGDLAADIDHADCAFIVTDTAGRSRLSGIALDTLVIDDPSYRALVDRHRNTHRWPTG